MTILTDASDLAIAEAENAATILSQIEQLKEGADKLEASARACQKKAKQLLATLGERDGDDPHLEIEQENAPNFIHIQWIRDILFDVAQEAQVYYLYELGEYYSVEQLFHCLLLWFDSSVEKLCDNAFDFCIKDSINTFNREAFDLALLRIKPTEDIQLSEEEIMLSIQVPNDDGTNLGAQISQAKVGVILHHLEKIRTQVELIDLLDAFELLVEKEKSKNAILKDNLNYVLDCLTEAECAIRYPEDWVAPRNWSAVCSCNRIENGKVDNLPY